MSQKLQIIQTPTDFSPDIGHCGLHGEYRFTSTIFRGRTIYNKTCPKCAEESTGSNIDEIKLNEAIADARRKSNIPVRYQTASFETFVAKSNDQKTALQSAVDFTKNFNIKTDIGTSLVFCGTPGTGKTHLACAIANCLISQGKPCHYAGAWWAIETVKQGFDGKKTLETIMAYSRYELLIIDEIGRQWGSEAERMLLYQIINKRYEAMRPTIVISNLDLEGLTKYLDSATIDRLRENGGRLVVFNWKSHRCN
jgi:DNA replication protein DnaC